MAWRPNVACFCKNIFTGEQPYPFIYVLSMAASTLACQNQVAATEAMQTIKPKLLSGPLQPCCSNACWELETASYLKETGEAIMRVRMCEMEEANTHFLGTARRRKPKTNTQIQSTESERPWGNTWASQYPRAWQGSLWCEDWKFHRHLLEDLMYLWLLWGEGYIKVFNMPGRMDFWLFFHFLGTQGSVFVIFHLLFYFQRNYSCCTRLQKLFFIFCVYFSLGK